MSQPHLSQSPFLQQFLAAHLPPHKLAQLEQGWQHYQNSIQTARQLRTAASAELQYAAALESLSWQKQSMQTSGGSSAERAQASRQRAEMGRAGMMGS